MTIFYKFKPVDTLFFKGAEPMSMGDDHTSSLIFPPAPSTISGAIRTAYLKQHEVNIKDYINGMAEQKVYDSIGKPENKAPFSIIGPFFKKNDDYFIPAPYSWYEEKKEEKEKKDERVAVIKGKKINSPLIILNKDIYWAKGSGNLFSIGGGWIKINDFIEGKKTIAILRNDDFADFEPRTGIKIDNDKRTVEEGHIYSFTHIRLKESVELIFGIDEDLDIEDKGILKLGAEQRFGEYEKINNMFNKNNEGEFYLSLSIVEANKLTNESIIATGKTKYIGGWDMKKGFHKDLKGYYPAGTVFNKKISNNLIQFKGE
jgi:CRISPR-associated protein Cmr3